MKGLKAYALVNATVRALYSMLLEPEIWNALIQAQNFDAVLSILSKTVYGPYLQIDRQALTPRRTVYQISWHLADVYRKIIRLTPEPGRELLIQLWRLYEVDNLKAVLRGVETGASWQQVRYLLHPIPDQHVTLTESDMETVLHSEDMATAIQHIHHTPYYDTLAHALERYQTEKNLFPLEVALDLDYRRQLWQTVNQLKGLDHEKALHIVGTLIDIDNLLWAIRYRVYHHLSMEEIINYTLPFGYRAHDADIRAIAEGADIRQVVQRIYPELTLPSDWTKSPADVPSDQGPPALEQALAHHVIKLCRKTFHQGYPFHLGTPLAYLQINEHEIKDLTVLIEAKASRLPKDIFMPMLEIAS
jgi:vacuolar-type H+-ATPase subunit C/Vma6